ncbi:MAG: FAD-dependent oxidoreductase [Deltaproteobacteria bacterium]|nr:FAD-dependent oxidoreductase [Deltaproteobacteria bacterium]
MIFCTLKKSYPVIIAGGGINGVGIARDCALRGIECLLIEKDDFAAGTSGYSSGMIHGGPRYMLSDRDITKLSCVDSGYIQRAAPHLLFRIPFLYTVFKTKDRSGLKSTLLLEGIETFFTAYDKFAPFKGGKKHTRLSPQEISVLEPGIPQKNLVGGVSFDEWGVDVPRLCMANVICAKEHGATVLNHTKITKVIKEAEQVKGVEVVDTLTGDKATILCTLLVNATGPWSPNFGTMAGVPIKLRGGKGIHISFDRRLFNIAVVSQTIDGREIFIFPHENESILGTTDDDYFGDLDQQSCTHDELEYLLEGIEQIFPAVRKARMIRAWSGVRPTLYKRNCYEDDLSREHETIDHQKRDGVSGLVSIVGGKLASYRIISAEVADLIACKLAIDRPSTTHQVPLPGGDEIPDVKTLADEYNINAYIVSRLVYRHGSRARLILNDIKASPELGGLICRCEPVTEAEIRYCLQNEGARTLSDIRRRTRLSMGPCQGTNCLLPGHAILSEIIDDSKNNAGGTLKDFMREWWFNRACVLSGDQLKQEELYQGTLFCNNSLNRS